MFEAMSARVIERKTYSIPEVAKILGVGKVRLYDMARNGELPGAIIIGNRYLVSRKVFDAWLDGELPEQETTA